MIDVVCVLEEFCVSFEEYYDSTHPGFSMQLNRALAVHNKSMYVSTLGATSLTVLMVEELMLKFLTAMNWMLRSSKFGRCSFAMSEKFAKSKGGPLCSATSDVLVKIVLSGDAILAYDLTPHLTLETKRSH